MPDDKPFVHLHVHTEYSLLDGLSPIKKLVKRAAETGMPSLAITDHGAMFGVIDFYRAAKEAGVKPIIGMETYITPWGKRMDERDPTYYHLLLLAKNQTGYKNLLHIASQAQLRGYYYHPRIDHDFLQAHAEGLIATSGCLGAEIPGILEQGREEEALRMIGWHQDVFGKENFFLELQSHQIPELKTLNHWLVENQTYAGTPLVATNDVHYVLEDDYDAHDTLLCIQMGKVKSDPKRMRFSGPTFHLRSAEEMWRLFADVPESLYNTVRIADMCDVNLDSKGYHLPVFPVPEGYSADTYLRALCEHGLTWRYGEDADDPAKLERLDYELRMIHQMGFDTYFLIVWDLCEFARHADIWWNVRGSGAGSLAAYCLGITNLDPLTNSLLFERFLNPGRVSMPDIDMDFPEDRRAEMIQYCAQKYGEDKVAAIITFGTMGSKAAIRDVGRALDMPLPEVDRIARLIPTGAKPVKFKDALGDDPEVALPELKEAYAKDETAHTLIDVAKQLEGITRHASTHAAGVIVADRPLVEYVPLHRPTKGTADEVPVGQVTQFDMETSESLGLLKIDFLGLSTLTIMRRACDLIAQQHGVEFDLSNIPYRHLPDDPETNAKIDQMFAMIGRGETIGVFQLESQGMRRMLTDMRPQKFENIVAAVALYRPGPLEYIPMYNRRLHGEEQVEYKHPKLKDLLEETYGIIVYQESIMQIGAELFGYSLGEADLMRRAVSKKKKEALQEHRDIFMERGPEHGVSPEVASAIFDDIEFFARYGFNKCLSADTEIIDAATGRLVRIGDLAAGTATIEHTLTLDTASQSIVSGRIAQVTENGIKPVYQLTTQSRRQITATDNHPFYTPDGWRTLGELKRFDQIAVPRRIPVAGKKEWPEEHITALVETLCQDSSDAVLPDEVFELTNRQIALLFARLWEQRGFNRIINAFNWRLCLFTFKSERLIRQFYHLSLRLGIFTHPINVGDMTSAQGRGLFIEDLTDFRRLMKTVGPYLSDEKLRASYERGLVEVETGPLPPEFQHIRSSSSEDCDIYWDELSGIAYVGEEMTYDLTVPDTHNFIANDIIVHNSHAADYAMMTCQTAYLKCHYPHEYMAALMSVHRDDSAKVGLFAADCHRMGIDVLPPTVNGSQLDFGIEKQRDGKRAVRFGLGAIKNLGVGPVEHIIEQRSQGGRFRDLDDFCRRVDTRLVNKRALESLIKVGAMDEFALRPVLLTALDRIVSFSSDLHKAQDSGQISLFGDATGVDFGAQESILAHMQDVEPVSKREMLNWEKELVGLYVTDHPLSGLRDLYANSRISTSAELVEAGEEANGKAVTVAGLVAAVRKVTTKKGDMMAILTLEDITGTIGAVMFPRTWDGYRHMIEEDAVVIVMGKADTSRGDLQIIVESVSQEMEIATLADEVPNLERTFSWLEAEDAAPEEPAESRPPAEEPPSPAPEPAARSTAAEPPPDLGPVADAEMPGWLEAEMEHNGWSPKPEIEYSEAGYVQDIQKRPAEAVPPPADPTPKPEREIPRRPRPQPPQPAPELPPGRMLTLRIERTGDAAKDKRRIQNLHGRLIQYPGRDHFRFVLRGGGVKAVCMNFPQHPIAINDEVLDMVIALLGEENVEIGE